MGTARTTYDKEPEIRISGYDAQAFGTRGAVVEELAARTARGAALLVVECYPGVRHEVLELAEEAFEPALTVRAEEAYLPSEQIDLMLRPHVTDDRVRGTMFYGTLRDLVDPDKLAAAALRARESLAAGKRVLVYGFGAALVAQEVEKLAAPALLAHTARPARAEPLPAAQPGRSARSGSAQPLRFSSVLVYADLARWEIQLRYRAGMPNHFWDNPGEDSLRKVKRGYFIEWRLADRLKAELLGRVDYLLDTNRAGAPVMVTGDAFRAGLAAVVRRPFRLVPYFDPGVWGGQWMKERCGLDPAAPNYAWAFDGVPEENSLYLRFGSVRVEVPAQDAVIAHPRELLGEKVFARFGAEFPIRFDFLDTMGGQNLSLQVHPLTEYIRSRFGMTYTQDESYYILDCGEGAGVYLGLKEGVDPAAMMADLRAAQAGGPAFNADRYVNRFPAHKHDHFLIPAGTVHCSSANCMVLEVSATPYIFTFKLWDWGRVGLDGLPRPIHLDDGERNIQWDRTTGWVERNLVNRFEVLREEDGLAEERTGLHELEFIETRRITATRRCAFSAAEGVHVLNLVEGAEAVVESPAEAFEPFAVHYAETFIVPAAAGAYTLRPAQAGEKIVLIQAWVRGR